MFWSASVPTPEALTCVSFQYGIQNSGGYTAEDIFNEVNNTLKTGLLIATRNVTIQTLNETFPRDDDTSSSGRALRSEGLQISHHWSLVAPEDRSGSPIHDALLPIQAYSGHGMMTNPATPASQLFNVMDLGRFQSDNSRRVQGAIDDDQRRRRTVFLPRDFSDVDDRGGRRLVFYTDEYAPVINSIIANEFCDRPPEINCAVVDSTVCVVLEEGDNEEEVRAALLNGFATSIQDGTFQGAIPPENQIPGDVVE
jgi:hypothetical protein